MFGCGSSPAGYALLANDKAEDSLAAGPRDMHEIAGIRKENDIRNKSSTGPVTTLTNKIDNYSILLDEKRTWGLPRYS